MNHNQKSECFQEVHIYKVHMIISPQRAKKKSWHFHYDGWYRCSMHIFSITPFYSNPKVKIDTRILIKIADL